MDAYEATRVVLSRIQSLDPENASQIIGLLLVQDHGDKEMIRLAFGPEALLHSVVVKARQDLGLLPPPSLGSPAAASPFLSRQNSAPRMLASCGLPSPLSVSTPTSWPPPPVFSRSNSVNGGAGANASAADELMGAEEMISPGHCAAASPFYGGGDLIDEFQLQEQLSFLSEGQGSNYPLPIASKPGAGESLYADVECLSPGASSDGGLFPYGAGVAWASNGVHRRSCSFTDVCLGADAAMVGLGWKPCLYFARGYCKNGASCRFLHGLPDDATTDIAIEQQCQELLLCSKSQRLGSATSQLMASAVAAFPYSPTGSVPPSPFSSRKCLSFLLQQQQTERQRAAAALLLGGDEAHKFMGRSRLDRSELANMVNPGARQIYLTFPADSTFREEDVANYFSIYGPVQDVRIPYQQKRMFGFVTFTYPETVKLILAKGNPHFICGARVLVKPYKEKGKVPEKYRKQTHQAEKMDFSGCATSTGLHLRDTNDLQQLRRKLEEQQQAAELYQAIELQSRRLMGLHLLDLRAVRGGGAAPNPAAATPFPVVGGGRSNAGSREELPPEGRSPGSGGGEAENAVAAGGSLPPTVVAVNAGDDKEESNGEASPNVDSDFQGSAEHNLLDSPFASPTDQVSLWAQGIHGCSQQPSSRLYDRHGFPQTLLPHVQVVLRGHGETVKLQEELVVSWERVMPSNPKPMPADETVEKWTGLQVKLFSRQHREEEGGQKDHSHHLVEEQRTSVMAPLRFVTA